MEVAYKNLMLDALPTPTTSEIHLHTADPGTGDDNVIAGVTITNIVFAAAASGQRIVTYDAQVPSDATTVTHMSIWDGANRVTVGDPPDKTLDIADTLHGTHTYSI